MEGKQARRDEQPTHLPTEFDESTENTAETGHQSSGKSSLSAFLLHRVACKHHLPLSHPFRLVVCVPITIPLQPLANRNLWQADILHHGPHDRQTRSFGRKSVNRIGALSHVAKKAFNGVGRANIAVHDLREGIKDQQMLFIFDQAPYSFWVALLIFGECSRSN